MMTPAFEKAARNFVARARLGIRSIPSLVAFRHGREIDRHSAVLDNRSLTRWLDSILA